ncbi:MAG: DUF6530 family protein [Candidatus Neomarinimicrobiota bacterium]|nr:DUF6530 family protein [Candidatus Neomarinimicrobiota bacterium]MDX9781345.1 DUF6530 family protein [bacterium]
MKIPTELKHKPVIISEDYDRIDGRNRNSEAKGLSLGLAQWNERGKLDISAKIWRHTGGKWSRQSEEMPLHRVLDLAILICRSRLYFLERYKKENSDFPLPERIGLQGGALNVALAEENSQIAGDIELFEEALHRDDEILSERLNVLHGLLNELHTR